MNLLEILVLFCAIGSGLIAGVFFAFSTSVMSALGKIDPAQGMLAMQTINIVIINPLFLGAFMGTAAACAAVLIANWMGALDSSWTVAGAALYLAGSFLVTMIFNVPRNNRLAPLNPAAPESLRVWRDYLVTWTRWNHVRTIASLAAAIAFTVGAS